MTTPPAPRGRPRSRTTDRRISEAAVGLLREVGPHAVTVDGVAQRSGVARTTIYRRFADRQALLEAVLGDLLTQPLPPPQLPLPEKLRWILLQIELLLEQGLGRGGVAAVLTGADPTFSSALRTSLETQLGVLHDLVRADVDEGRVDAAIDPEALVTVLVGTYLGEVLRHDGPRPGTVEAVVGLLTRIAEPKTPGGGAGPEVTLVP